ncbi:MAG: hypothetical protein WKG00_11750 [Polyangiaceae bacterium]
MSGGKQDFLKTIAAELERAKAEDVAGKLARDMLARPGVREELAALKQLQAEPIEPPPAEPSERVEHLESVPEPASMTLEKVPKVQLDAHIDPRRADTVRGLGSIVRPAARLPANPAAEEVVGERTVGGNTGRFKEGVEQAPVSAPASPEALSDDGEVTLPRNRFAVDPSRMEMPDRALLASSHAPSSEPLPGSAVVAPERAAGVPRSGAWLALAGAVLALVLVALLYNGFSGSSGSLAGAQTAYEPLALPPPTGVSADQTGPGQIMTPTSVQPALPTPPAATGSNENPTSTGPVPAKTSKPRGPAKPGGQRSTPAPYDASPALPLIIESDP